MVNVDDSLSVYAGDGVTLNTHSVEVAAGGLASAFAGDGASLTAGAGGVMLVAGGDVSLRTAAHMAEMQDGLASLRSTSEIDLSAGQLDLNSGDIEVHGTADATATSRITVQLDCAKFGSQGCTELPEESAMQEAIAGLLEVPLSRVRIRALDETAAPVPAPVYEHENLGRRRRLLDSLGDARDPGERRFMGADKFYPGADARTLHALRDEKKAISRALVAHCKAAGTPRAEAGRLTALVLAHANVEPVLALWVEATDVASGEVDMDAFVSALGVMPDLS
jgi:hypothetical protein